MRHVRNLMLGRIVAVALLGSVVLGLAMPAAAFVPCDLNRDGVVNLIDVSIFSMLWQDYVKTGTYHPRIDMNHDGVINLVDVAIFARCF